MEYSLYRLHKLLFGFLREILAFLTFTSNKGTGQTRGQVTRLFGRQTHYLSLCFFGVSEALSQPMNEVVSSAACVNMRICFIENLLKCFPPLLHDPREFYAAFLRPFVTK